MFQTPEKCSVTYPRCGISAACHQQVKSRMKVQIIGCTQVSVVVPDDLINTSTSSGTKRISAAQQNILHFKQPTIFNF